MTRINPRRRIERAGVNALRALLEDHDYLVQEIDGGVDHGEDLYVAIVRDGRRTGHVFAVQVKSGKKYRRANGYAIPVEDHRDDWTQSKIPVIGVVYDVDTCRLFWINLTMELRTGSEVSWIRLPDTNELNHKTIGQFAADVETFAEATQPRPAPAREEDPDQVTRMTPGHKEHGVPSRPLSHLDPFALEVHHAIRLSGSTSGSGLPLLPKYVSRPHDDELDEVTAQAVGGRSIMAVLVGSSSSGKTRACWEAVQKLPSSWRLWHPYDPTRPESLLGLVGSIGPRTVVWLNESQHYLLTHNTDLGERVAAALRTLLDDRDRGPVLILGTMWSQYWHTLTAPAPFEPDQPDPHAQARQLLHGSRIAVPSSFDNHDMARLRLLAPSDPRLRAALESAEQHQITQFLAAGPALADRYETAPPFARGLLDAAIDARRFGHGPFLPAALIETAARGYLTDFEWEQVSGRASWLDDAIAYVTAPVRGARGALTRYEPTNVSPHKAGPFYHLADYVEQYGRTKRVRTIAPAAFWDACHAHAGAADLELLAEEASHRGLMRFAVLLDVAAARRGATQALVHAARILGQTRARPEETEGFWRQAVLAGNIAALRRQGIRMRAKGDFEGALATFTQAAEAGDTGSLVKAVELFVQLRQVEAGLHWLETRAEAGSVQALRMKASVHWHGGRVDEALEDFDRAASKGDTEASWTAAELLRRAGKTDDALAWYARGARAGDAFAVRAGVRLLHTDGRAAEAAQWMRQYFSPPGSAMHVKLAALERMDSIVEQAAASRRRDVKGQEGPRRHTAIGRLLAAPTSAQSALEREIAALRNEGREHEVLALLEVQADAGSGWAMYEMARTLRLLGKLDSADRLLTYGREPDGQISQPWTASMPHTSGHHVDSDSEC